jgi:hypothetical protein
VNCNPRDSVSHLLTHLVVYIIARCSSLNTTTFCLIRVCTVLPHPTEGTDAEELQNWLNRHVKNEIQVQKEAKLWVELCVEDFKASDKALSISDVLGTIMDHTRLRDLVAGFFRRPHLPKSKSINLSLPDWLACR